MLTDTELRHAISMGESHELEFKAGIPAVDVIARELSAFANSSGGRLILGVAEARDAVADQIVGVDAERALASVKRAVDRLGPQPQVNTEVISVSGRNVVIIDIPAFPTAPVLANNTAYMKDGERTRRATADHLLANVTRSVIERAPEHLDRTDLRQLLEGSLHDLTETIRHQGIAIEELRDAASWKRQLAWVIVGAIIGALLGVIPTLLFG